MAGCVHDSSLQDLWHWLSWPGGMHLALYNNGGLLRFAIMYDVLCCKC